MSEASPDPPSSEPAKSVGDLLVRYDLAYMKEEVKREFTADSGSNRLLRQSDISKRFNRRRALRKSKSNGEGS